MTFPTRTRLTKNKKRREVYFGDKAQAALLNWLDVRPEGFGDQLFLGVRGNGWSHKKFHGSSISHMWAGHQQEAGIVYPHRFHDIRHTSITDSLNTGVAKHHVGAQAGHISSQSTDIYTHSQDPERQRAFENRNPDDLLEERVKGKKSET